MKKPEDSTKERRRDPESKIQDLDENSRADQVARDLNGLIEVKEQLRQQRKASEAQDQAHELELARIKADTDKTIGVADADARAKEAEARLAEASLAETELAKERNNEKEKSTSPEEGRYSKSTEPVITPDETTPNEAISSRPVEEEFEVEIYEDDDGSFYYIDPDSGEELPCDEDGGPLDFGIIYERRAGTVAVVEMPPVAPVPEVDKKIEVHPIEAHLSYKSHLLSSIIVGVLFAPLYIFVFDETYSSLSEHLDLWTYWAGICLPVVFLILACLAFRDDGPELYVLSILLFPVSYGMAAFSVISYLYGTFWLVSLAFATIAFCHFYYNRFFSHLENHVAEIFYPAIALIASVLCFVWLETMPDLSEFALSFETFVRFWIPPVIKYDFAYLLISFCIGYALSSGIGTYLPETDVDKDLYPFTGAQAAIIFFIVDFYVYDLGNLFIAIPFAVVLVFISIQCFRRWESRFRILLSLFLG